MLRIFTLYTSSVLMKVLFDVQEQCFFSPNAGYDLMFNAFTVNCRGIWLFTKQYHRLECVFILLVQTFNLYNIQGQVSMQTQYSRLYFIYEC